AVHFNLVNFDEKVLIDFNVNTMMQEFHSESSLEAGRWYHVAATYDNPNQTAKIYINGQVDSISTNDTGAPALIGEAAIGDWLDPFYETDRHFDGVLDDVRIYDSALSEEDIAELYKNTGTAKSEPTLTSTKHTVRKVSLPDADKIKGAVLDLAGGDLLDAGEGDDHLIGRFTELGKGDIAYDTVNSSHALICVRGSKAERMEENNKRIVLNPDEQTGDVKAYKLTEVPCVLIITTGSRREYLLSIISADDEELVLEYTLLSSRAR
ncbi:MAG: LamG domain-containing protein, partial [Planctomycetota bacterium]